MRRDLALATFYWMLLVLWMALIFFFSAQAALQSKELSSGLTGFFIQAIERFFPAWNFSATAFHGLIRKIAHFVIYFVLGLFMIQALRASKITWKKATLLALVLCSVYAVTDEYHQFFVPGRGAQVTDVLLDSVASSLGVLSYYSWKRKE
jgi:VanZ family protein